MIDVNILVKTWLLAPSITVGSLVLFNPVPQFLRDHFIPGGAFPNDSPDTRVYAGHLRPGVDLTFGPAFVIRVGSGASAGTGGGSAHPEIPIISPRVQLTVWAAPNQMDIARAGYCAAFDWMHGRNDIDFGDIGHIFSSIEITEGQEYDDPHTSSATNISFWKIVAGVRPLTAV